MGYVWPLFGSLSSKIIDFWENEVIQVVPSGLARYEGIMIAGSELWGILQTGLKNCLRNFSKRWRTLCNLWRNGRKSLKVSSSLIGEAACETYEINTHQWNSSTKSLNGGAIDVSR